MTASAIRVSDSEQVELSVFEQDKPRPNPSDQRPARPTERHSGPVSKTQIKTELTSPQFPHPICDPELSHKIVILSEAQRSRKPALSVAEGDLHFV